MLRLAFLTFKLIVLSWIVAKRQLIHNRTAQRNSWKNSYDFIVVGAGGAGCAVASRLAEDPRVKVLLLEAGGPQDAIYTDIYWPTYLIEENRPDLHWHYYNEPITVKGMSTERLFIPFGKMIGGTSAHNAIAFNRGNRRLFNRWKEVYGAVGWGYSDVMPYFLKYENNTDIKLVRKYPAYHGVNGPVQISSQRKPSPRILTSLTKAYNDLGYQNTDFNGPNQTGTSFVQLFLDSHGNRVSGGTAYVDPNPHPVNLHIVTRALVTKIIFKDNTAIGVKFERNSTTFRVYAHREVILSAGPINSPQILMMSGVGLRSHLNKFNIPVLKELPVGNNLMDNPSVTISSNIHPAYSARSKIINLEQLAEHYFNNSGPLGEGPQIASFFSTRNNSDLNFPNILVYHMFYELLNSYGVDGSILSTIVWVVIIRSRGTVRLKSNDPHDFPKIDPRYYRDLRDFYDMLDALRFIFYILETPELGIAKILRNPTFESIGCPTCPGKYMYECTEGLTCLIVNLGSGSSHHCGTCRMGDVNRADVVVDPLLRVKGLNNLRVCDASIFPEMPNSNPWAAVLMVAEKCAQLIKECHHLI